MNYNLFSGISEYVKNLKNNEIQVHIFSTHVNCSAILGM